MRAPSRREFFARALGSLFLGGAAACVAEDEAPPAELPPPRGADVGAYDVIVYGPGGLPLVEGDVITGAANVAAVYLQNGIVRYKPVRPVPLDELSSEGQLYRWDGSAYVDALDSGRGDGFVIVTPNMNPPDRITVISASVNEVEIAAEWDAWDLDTGYLATPGLPSRDHVSPGGSGGLNYEQLTSTPKFITESRIVKTAILRRGHEGVFIGVHTQPSLCPADNLGAAAYNSTDYGEREVHLGINVAVTFASTGLSAHFPEWGSNDRWGAFSPANRHWWCGIDDAEAGVALNPAYIALQPAGFPAHQAVGPWWMAALHVNNATTYPFCSYVIMRDHYEIGAFQFTHDAYAQPTVHLIRETHDAANIPCRAQLFIGAFPYESPDLALEPTVALQAAVAARASLDFETSGQIAVDPETTPTAGDVISGGLTIYRGEETVYLLHATVDGEPRELTEDMTIECQIRDAAGGDDVHAALYLGAGITLLTQTGDNIGAFYVLLSSTQTAAIPAGVAYLDVCIVDGGARHYVVRPRRVVVRDVVNQP